MFSSQLPIAGAEIRTKADKNIAGVIRKVSHVISEIRKA
jgi:hypothetical protein